MFPRPRPAWIFVILSHLKREEAPPRRGRLLCLDAIFGAEPASRFRLEVDQAASEEQKAHRKAWLGE
jgi:hypothetical protein